ncbi:MAG: hypothetical protein ACRC6T_11725 [Sarcina sp.]
MSRLKIIIEFNPKDSREIEIFERLKSITYPGTMIKDVLCKRVPFTVVEKILEGCYENS